MNEAAFQKKCCSYAKTFGVLAYKFASPAHRGVPDVVFIFPSTTLFVEFKHPDGTGKLSKLQVLTIDKMRKAGATIYVCDNFEDFKAIIEIHLNG